MDLNIETIVGGGVATIVAIITIVPKLLSGWNQQKVDTAITHSQMEIVTQLQDTYDNVIKKMGDRIDLLETKVNNLNNTVNEQETEIGRLVYLVMQFRSVLELNNIKLSSHLLKEFEDIINRKKNIK